MNYYQIIPTKYIDKLIADELYQKAGAFQNYWRLFYKYYVKDNDITSVEDVDIEHLKKRYSLRTLSKIFGIGKDSAKKWRDEFIDEIANFIAHWKLLKSQKNTTQDNYTQKQGRQRVDTYSTNGRQQVDTQVDNNDIEETTKKSEFQSDDKNHSRHSNRQRVDTYSTNGRQQVDKYKTYNNNIKNNKKIKKEWLENFLSALSKISKEVQAKRNEFDSLFMNLFTLYDDVEEVIEWASNNDFWMDKLIDPRSIKRNFEKMRLQMLKEKSKKPIPNGPNKVEQIKDELEAIRAIYEKKLNKEIA